MPETLHLLTYAYVEGMVERRAPHRDAHLGRIDEAVAAGTVVIGGATGDPPDTGLIAFRTREAAEAFAAGDPYVEAGLVVSRTIRPWTVVTPLP